MSQIAIQFDHVGKLYRLGTVGTGTLSHDLNRWWKTRVLHQEDPYLKIGETNDRAHRGQSDYVWALKDISFSVEQGDVVGIIGKNGAGKSTLLKLLSQITSPTTGVIRARGRIGSLLEVGTGFHPEMTGRENIYMNGAIMGMTRHEITRKLDEIIDFAGIARYIDTPVKRYSSGMTVRLGFAVAAFMEPEILVVDEVLAVGDAEFQKKAIGKMQDVSRGEGRTVLFVSHNMAAVRSLCQKGVVLKDGKLDYTGSSEECVNYYAETNISELVSHAEEKDFKKRMKGPKDIYYLDIKMLNDVRCVSTLEPLEFEIVIRRTNIKIDKCQIGVLAKNETDALIWASYSPSIKLPANRTDFRLRLSIPGHNTPKGRYTLIFNISEFDYSAAIHDYDIVFGVISFEVNYVDDSHTRPFSVWPFSGGCAITNAIVKLI